MQYAAEQDAGRHLKPHATGRRLPGSACAPQALAACVGGPSGAVPCMTTATRGAAAPAVCGRWGSHQQAVPCRRKGKQPSAPCIAGGGCTERRIQLSSSVRASELASKARRRGGPPPPWPVLQRAGEDGTGDSSAASCPVPGSWCTDMVTLRRIPSPLRLVGVPAYTSKPAPAQMLGAPCPAPAGAGAAAAHPSAGLLLAGVSGVGAGVLAPSIQSGPSWEGGGSLAEGRTRRQIVAHLPHAAPLRRRHL